MLALRRLLACRASGLRFSSSGSKWDDFEALSIEEQIEEIDKIQGDACGMVEICQRKIRQKSEAVQKVFRKTKKAPFEYVSKWPGHLPLEAPDVKTILKAFEKWDDLKDVPPIDDYTSGTLDETKLLKAVETWEGVKNEFENFYVPMRDVEEDLKLLFAVRILQARVNDVKKRLQNDEE